MYISIYNECKDGLFLLYSSYRLTRTRIFSLINIQTEALRAPRPSLCICIPTAFEKPKKALSSYFSPAST